MGLLKKFKGAVKKITKPVSKFLGKVIPREVKPFLPFAAAAVPFLAPTAGIFGSMAGRAALSGGANLLSQLAQEGSEGDFSGLSALLAAGTGALSAPTAKSAIAQRFGSPAATGADAGFFVSEGINPGQAVINPGTSFVGEGLTSLAEAAGKTRDILSPGGIPAGLDKATFAAAAVPFGQGTTDLAMATARKALKDYEDELAAYEAETGEAQTASDDARRTAIIAAMTAGRHSQEVIDSVLSNLGLKDGGVVKMKDGGIMDLGGKEMDLRGGGFVPIGKKERADDVPARLSKNEFVMTADAVRGAGGGNINEGARRMYETMNKLEARA